MVILDRFRLDGRVALVSGTSRGLGQAAAIALAEAGADLALLDRAVPHDTVARIERLGRKVHMVQRDLLGASVDDLEAAVDETASALGRLDIVVNNAGIIRRAPAVNYNAQDWSDVLSVNLDAVFHLSQAAGRHMVSQRSGRIINVASMLSFQGGVTVPAYAASKHAVAGLTKALANEWGAFGVTVNAVAPGYMATDNTEALRKDVDRERSILTRIPAGRWGVPGDLQGVFVFLASDAAAYVNGAIVPVDGGWLVR